MSTKEQQINESDDRKALKMLSEEQQKEITGGASDIQTLTEKQCNKLREKVDKLRPKIPLVVAYGCPSPRMMREINKDEKNTL